MHTADTVTWISIHLIHSTQTETTVACVVFSGYCNFALMSLYSLCTTGSYLIGLSVLAHSDMHSIKASISGLTK